MVYVAVFIYGGVLEGLEIYTDKEEAETQADKWREDARPVIDVVDVLEREMHLDIMRKFPNLFRD